MNKFQLEAKVIQIVENALTGKPNEDSLVELKREWVKPEDIARQLAGQANAARGEPILWIIGVDQKSRKLIEVSHEELSNWRDKLASQFVEGFAPLLALDLNISYDGYTLVALFFETDRFPYLIKHSDHRNEVPWREGTSTRSALRSDLLKLLSPLQVLPTLEVLFAKLEIRIRDDGHINRMDYSIALYITPNDDKRLVVPFRNCEMTITIVNTAFVETISPVKWRTPHSPNLLSYTIGGGRQGSGPSNLSHTIENGPDELLIDGPGKVEIDRGITFDNEIENIDINRDSIITVTMLPVRASVPVSVEVALKKHEVISDNPTRHIWVLKK